MSKSNRTNEFAGHFSTDTLSIRDKSSVTQATNIATGVTLNSQSGRIITTSASTAAQSAQSFTVSNVNIKTDSIVLSNIIGYNGSTGLPQVYVDDIISGSFKIVIQNNSTSAALNGSLNIGYVCL